MGGGCANARQRARLAVATDLTSQAETLIRDYLQDGGCPCRFPRFRSVVKRDTGKSLGAPCRGEDQCALIVAFEHHAPYGERKALGPFSEARGDFWQAVCTRCTSQIERSSHEVVAGGWVDYLVIRRTREASELGPPLDHIFRCRPLVPLGPGPHNLASAAKLYPHIDDDEWFTWLRARTP